jgi:hypothetical protein
MNSQGRFFHYEPLFKSSFSKNFIIPEALSKSVYFEGLNYYQDRKRYVT